MKHAVKQMFKIQFFVIASLIGLAAIVIYPNVETLSGKYFPVIDDIIVSHYEEKGDHIEIGGTVIRNKTCDLIRYSIHRGIKESEQNDNAHYSLKDLTSTELGINTVGKSNWGMLVVNASIYEIENDYLWAHVTFKCNSFYKTKQIVRLRHTHPLRTMDTMDSTNSHTSHKK